MRSFPSTVIKRFASATSTLQTQLSYTTALQTPLHYHQPKQQPKQQQQQQQWNQQTQRTFTSTTPKPSSPSSTLAALLAAERKAEQMITHDSSLTPALAELKEKITPNWTIVDGSSDLSANSGNGGSITRMIRKKPLPNGAKVTITFHCQDSLQDEPGMFDGMFDGDDDDDDNNNNNQQDQDDEEDEEDESPPFRFEAAISRAGTTLHLNCLTEDAVASVEGATITTGDGENTGVVDPIAEGFRGPDLEELPENVQKAMDKFLVEGCGVDGDVAAFVAMYADYREQVEYVRWLDGVIKVVGK